MLFPAVAFCHLNCGNVAARSTVKQHELSAWTCCAKSYRTGNRFVAIKIDRALEARDCILRVLRAESNQAEFHLSNWRKPGRPGR